MREQSTILRFAVSTYDTCEDVYEAVQRLGHEGFGLNSCCCLGLKHVLTKPAAAALLPGAELKELAFPQCLTPLCCTAGVLAQRLLERLLAGDGSLEIALGHWLIARHAAALQAAVELNRVVLWVQLFDSDGEHRAYRSLLSGRSAAPVGVHDIVGD